MLAVPGTVGYGTFVRLPLAPPTPWESGCEARDRSSALRKWRATLSSFNVSSVRSGPVRVGGREVALKSPALYDGREVYLPLDSLHAFNASYKTTQRDETAYITFEAPISGMSMNPARSFASALLADRWTAFWIYVAAPLIGMLLAAELRLRLSPRPVRCAKLHHDNPRRCIFRCGYAR